MREGPNLLEGQTKLLYNVADAGKKRCVSKALGVQVREQETLRGRVRTCRVRVSGRSWRNQRSEL